MVPFPLIWLQCRAAQERLRETFAESPLPDEESYLKSSPPVPQADGETASREVDPIAPELTGKDEGERPARKCVHRLEIGRKDLWNLGSVIIAIHFEVAGSFWQVTESISWEKDTAEVDVGKM